MKTKRPGFHIYDQYAMHFVTFTTVGWVDIFTRKQCRDIVIKSFDYCIKNKGMNLHAYVIMDNHLHCILSAKENTSGLSGIIRDMKKYLSNTLLKFLLNSRKESRRHWLEVVFKYHERFNKNNTHYQLWQQSNCPQILYLPKFTWQKLNYIHQNPVKAGIVDDENEYLYSSARNYSGRKDVVIDVVQIDFESEIGYIV